MRRPAVPSRRARHRFARGMRLAAAVSIIIAGLAVLQVVRGVPMLHISRLIVAALGIGFAVLLGTALMLLFPGNRRGHQADRGAAPIESDEQ